MKSSKMMALPFLFLSQVATATVNFEQILEKDRASGLDVIEVVTQPRFQKSLHLEFDLNGINLPPGKAVYLKLPESIQVGELDFASVAHRQDPAEENECRSENPEWDCNPGYTSLEVFNAVDGDERGWRCWGGMGSGPCNSKFAEVRSSYSPETDNLYEWRHNGHVAANGQGHSYEAVRPGMLRVRAVGNDSVHIHRIILKVLPTKASSLQDVIFADGLDFGDAITAQGRQYPGNENIGDYGNALSLNPYQTPQHEKIPADWTADQGSLKIPLRAGVKVSFIDVAIGDMRKVPPGGDPERYRGGAFLNVKWIRGGQTISTLMQRENVGMTGVMRGSPDNAEERAQLGDYLLIEGLNDQSSVMGIRLGLID